MVHIPVTDTKNPDEVIEFSHIREDAEKGHWKKENVISLKNIKINIFVEGNFLFFTDGKSYTPEYGDICVLSPFKMHSANITKPTHTDYFQIDIGIKALNFVPDGANLINKIISYSDSKKAFSRPADKYVKLIISVCNAIESAILSENKTLAFAKIIEMVSLLCEMYEKSENVPNNTFTLFTKNTINFIRENYSENITVKILAEKFNVSPSYLSRIFKKETGMGIHEYLMVYRVTKASKLLYKHSVADVCYMCAFSDSSHFISVFKKHFNVTPFQYKKMLGLTQ